MKQPPKLPGRILRFFCADHRIEELEGDLYEEYIENLEAFGARKASRIYTWTIARSFRHYLFDYHPNRYKLSYLNMMFKHYLKTAFRGMKKSKAITAINLFGLSVGIAISLLITLFVADQYLMDDFLPDKERIVRLEGLGESSAIQGFNPGMHPGFGPAIMQISPQVETYTRLNKFDLTIRVEEETGLAMFEETFLFADSTFFEIFPFALVKGNPNTILNSKTSLVITESMAKKLFGSEDPIGKTINAPYRGRSLFEVTGVLKDIPSNSSLQFDFLALTDDNYSMNSPGYSPSVTYLKLAPNTDQTALLEDIGSEIPKMTSNKFFAGLSYNFTPFVGVKYNTSSIDQVIIPIDKKIIELFVVVAILILLLANINYINLTAAKALQRGQEAGIRKVIGAGKGSFKYQFLTESLLFCWLALPIALLIVQGLLPMFEQVLEKPLYFNYLTNIPFLLSLFGLVTLFGLLAGLYPAFIISRFNFTDFLKGKISGTRKGSWFRKGLVIFQFTISVVLVVATFVVQRQLSFIQERAMSFEADQIIVSNGSLSSKFVPFKNALKEIPSVTQVSLTTSPPGGDDAASYGFDQILEEVIYSHKIDEHYIPLLNLEMISGEAFDEQTKNTNANGVIINETMARLIETKNPLNSEMPLKETYQQIGAPIRGVIKDFHIQSLHQSIKPMIFIYDEQKERTVAKVLIKINATNVSETLAKIESEWKKYMPNSILKTSFLDSRFEQLYTTEIRLGRVFGVLTIVAILISCLGLFGLITYMAEAKIKEIGIRKVLGATSSQVIWLLTRQVQILVLISCIIALPIAFYATKEWLDSFAYRTDVSLALLAVCALMALAISGLTVLTKSAKAANSNPIKALRSE